MVAGALGVPPIYPGDRSAVSLFDSAKVRPVLKRRLRLRLGGRFRIPRPALPASPTRPGSRGVRPSLGRFDEADPQIGQHLAQTVAGRERWGWLPYLMLWSGFLVGAGLGALAFPLWGLASLAAAVAGALVAAGAAWRLCPAA